MAIMSMAADGKVKLIPQIPRVDNEFGAPLPRLSKWGFCEGDYIHRAIDRNRLFWDIHIVPTSDYQFGSPLHPLPTPAADWPSLPEPPLPGKHDPDALLPIWSSIDGQTVTWPWWYRILNLVLQPLHLQPGATAADVFSHCLENTTELFEVELVLGWLESVGAITKIIGGGYQVTHGFWAAFGDRLLGMADDWFGEHVKRKTKTTMKQQWRHQYNLRYATMQKKSTQADEYGGARKTRSRGSTMGQRISGNARAQYGIVQQASLDTVPEGDETMVETGGRVPAEVMEQTMQEPEATTGAPEIPVQISAAAQEQTEQHPEATVGVQEDAMEVLQTPDETNTPDQDQDVDMLDVDTDADFDAEGEEEDAEYEVDDDMY
jgi:hypothetical protein